MNPAPDRHHARCYNIYMKLTKFMHACFVVEQADQTIVVDPGEFTADFTMPDDVSSVVVTHKHSDHISTELFSDIVRRYAEVKVFTPADNDQITSATAMKSGDSVQVGTVSLEFYGGEHAIIDESIPQIGNLGIMIDELVYYPGDAFVAPDKPVDTLLLPIAAPWMKISQAMDFVRTLRPRLVIPTHDAILSEAGQAVGDRLLGGLCAELDIEYRRLSSGESIIIE